MRECGTLKDLEEIVKELIPLIEQLPEDLKEWLRMEYKSIKTNLQIEWCKCGRLIKDGLCPRCKEKTIKWENKEKPRELIGRYSGKSKSENAFNEYK
jgi:hypothetical protein